jgi:hypothetical protein
VPDLTDIAALERVVSTFVARQDESLAGGVVVRAFEEFTSGEARVWWRDGVPVLVGPHPDTPRSGGGAGPVRRTAEGVCS